MIKRILLWIIILLSLPLALKTSQAETSSAARLKAKQAIIEVISRHNLRSFGTNEAALTFLDIQSPWAMAQEGDENYSLLKQQQGQWRLLASGISNQQDWSRRLQQSGVPRQLRWKWSWSRFPHHSHHFHHMRVGRMSSSHLDGSHRHGPIEMPSKRHH